MTTTKIHSIHHVNFPTTDAERTREWYGKVFGMEKVDVSAVSDTDVLLMTAGHCDLHFIPVKEMRRMAPFHYAVEVKNWDDFLGHLKGLGIRHTKPVLRPQNNSKFCYIHDPDGTMIEITYHDDWHA